MVSADVAAWSEVGMVVAVAGGSGVWVAGTVVDMDITAEEPAGGVISSASEQAERAIESTTKSNRTKDYARLVHT